MLLNRNDSTESIINSLRLLSQQLLNLSIIPSSQKYLLLGLPYLDLESHIPQLEHTLTKLQILLVLGYNHIKIVRMIHQEFHLINCLNNVSHRL